MNRLPLRGLTLVAGLMIVGPAAAAPADEVTTLETQLKVETTELSTADCAAACKALASIRRAAERICELEAGPRCDAARTKADDATKRVREACPTCAIAQFTRPEDEKKANAEPRPPSPTEAPRDAASVSGEKSDSHGGCRNCATSTGAPDRGDFAVFGLAIALLGIVRRRSKK